MNTPDLMAMTDDEYDAFMVAKFPAIFAERHLSRQETCMCRGFDGIGPGWRKLLHDLCEKLQRLGDLMGTTIRATQVKSKFGTLRFYYDITSDTDQLDSDIVSNIVSLAESRAGWTCEVCGDLALARTSGNGWVETLCPKHTAERDARKKDG